MVFNWFFPYFLDTSLNRSCEQFDETNDQNVTKYNLRENRITIESRSEWTPGAARRTKETYYAAKEKRNPLLEKVKNTKLTCFKSSQNFNTVSLYVSPVYDDGGGADDVTQSVQQAVPEQCPQIGPKSFSKSEWDLASDAEKSENFRISTKLRAISDKYLKSSTNKLLAKLYRSSDKDEKSCEKEKKLRSFSYGQLPGISEFQSLHDICDQKEGYDCNTDSVSNIVGDENEDCDSGILVSSNSSVVDSSPATCHFRSASQDGPLRDAESKLELTDRQKRRQRRPVDVLEYDPPLPELPPKNSPFLSNISRNYNVIKLTREELDEDVGVVVRNVRTIQNRDAFVVFDILAEGLAAR